jgi:hypothetical protein
VHGEYRRPFDGFSNLVGDSPTDDAHLREHEIDVIDGLTLGDIKEFSLFERSPLPVAQGQVATACHGQGVTTRRKVSNLIPAIGVGTDLAASRAQLRGGSIDASSAEGPSTRSGRDTPLYGSCA